MMRTKKIIYILFFMIMFGVSVGYALISSTININGKSSIRKNTWDVHFKNIVVTEGSVEPITVPSVDNTSISYELKLDLPGDFYEFTIEIENTGTIDAMLDSFVKTPDLTSSQQKYLNYIIEYENGEEITPKQLIKSNEFVRLRVRVEYRSDLSEADLPTESETLNLGFTANYIQSDKTGVSVLDNGVLNTGPKLITFTIAGNPYQAEEGMLWTEWVESSYNISNYEILSGFVYLNGAVLFDDNGVVQSYYSVIADQNYTTRIIV